MIELAILEKKTLLKGFVISFFVVLPFTFIPLISSSQRFIDRFPLSIFYSLVFAIFICLAALYHNYERQKFKINAFGKPAFKKLNFQYYQTGKGSLIEDLGFQLAGVHKNRFFIIDMWINEDNYDDFKLIIIPSIPIQANENPQLLLNNYKSALTRDFKCQITNNRLEIYLKPMEINFEDPLGITRVLNIIESKTRFAAQL